jgi:6,7-dimethyl-8-ribityllumazine synthase
MKLAIISSRFNEKAGNALETLNQTCEEKLQELGVEFEKFSVPGAFEIPTLAKKVLLTKKFDGVICLGVIVRGETMHFDFVASNVARKLADLGVEFAQPVIFGVLTTDTTEQAIIRAKRGAEFAQAGVDFVKELNKINP